MRIRFTKMQGAGNDFVVLDETRGTLGLSAAQYRFLADRHFGVGADQILTVRPSPAEGIDFQYVIHNADGGEVEQCGNGARCFMRFVSEHKLTEKTEVRVQTLAGIIEPRMGADGRVTVDMGAPVFEAARVPFDTAGLDAQPDGSWEKWHLALGTRAGTAIVSVAVLSMGNPHAVQVVDRSHIKLRVFERGAGETLACGTGACAAVVAGIRLGLLERRVDVQTHGGILTIEWQGEGQPVLMTGPATTVFEGDIEVPELP